MIPIRPVRHDVRVGDQNTRRICMGLHNSNRLARLHDQRLVRFKVFQTGNNPVEIIPCPCRPPDASIDHKFMRILSHFGMQIVHQHAHRSFGEPAFRRDLGACWRIDVSNVVTQIIHTGLQRIHSSGTILRCVRKRSARCVSKVQGEPCSQATQSQRGKVPTQTSFRHGYYQESSKHDLHAARPSQRIRAYQSCCCFQFWCHVSIGM